MIRPLTQRRIYELEAMFEAKQEDPDALRLLGAELAFRSVPRATALLAKVKRVLGGAYGAAHAGLDARQALSRALQIRPLSQISPNL